MRSETHPSLSEKNEQALAYLADPHRYFKAFSRTARRFQFSHRSPRLRTMTLVGIPSDFLSARPLYFMVFGRSEPLNAWEALLPRVVGDVLVERPGLIDGLSRAGLVPWMVAAPDVASLEAAFRTGRASLALETMNEAFRMAQWLLLMADVKLNEAVVQLDPYTDAQWQVRAAEIQRKREDETRVLKEIDDARRQYAEAHAETSVWDAGDEQ